MRNNIIETTIEKVVDESDNPNDFKSAFKQYVKNKFDGNDSESDLKRILALIKVDEEDC